MDPNFLLLAARTSAELETKAKSAPGKVLTDRKSALDQYVNDTAKHNGSFEQKMLGFLKEKATANDVMYEIYYGGSADRVKAFCEASDRAWSQAIPAVMKKLEELIKGPYALGDQVVSLLRSKLTRVPCRFPCDCLASPDYQAVGRRSYRSRDRLYQSSYWSQAPSVLVCVGGKAELQESVSRDLA